MKDADPSGVSKMEAAKSALINSLDAIPENTEVGLRVYGAGNDGNGAPGACTDSQNVHPVGPLDKNALTQRIQAFQPRGDTPIAYSLGEVAKDLGDQGKRHIILVSDGEETCDPDPCAMVKKIAEQGVDLQIDTVGFGVDDKTRKQLQRMADVARGTCYDAKDASALGQALSTLSARMARPFALSGTPVKGTETPDDAPVLTAGQYTDFSPSSALQDTVRYYKIKRQIPNPTIRVSMVSRRPGMGYFDNNSQWYFTLNLPGENAQSCNFAGESDLDFGREGVVISHSSNVWPDAPKDGAATPTATGCSQAEELVYEIKRFKGADGFDPMEIRVIEEPTPENLAELPEGVTEVPTRKSDELTSPASGDPKPVIGGAGFSDVLELTSGTYSTELIPGEKVFFKTHIEYGQSAIFSQDDLHLSEPVLNGLGSAGFPIVFTDVYGPDISKMNSEVGKSLYTRGPDGALKQMDGRILELPEARYRNRWDAPSIQVHSQGHSMDDFYYYAVGLSGNDVLKGQPATIDFSFAVRGEAAGKPSSSVSPTANIPSDAANPSPSGTATSTSDGSGGGFDGKLALIIGGGVLVVGGAAGAVIGIRRRLR